ncbi:MAG: DNA polymerase III subunit alpha, partial [Candidatus Marinimicrobia bacterium]|nr:DNA polymerase III subunit alpha [Candidatus Neomarinimicrobiota bacterium]
MSNFVHLHVHSDYSLLDASQKIESIIKKAKELDMKSIALTDHGNMFGAIKFYKIAKSFDIKPIIGCEIYVAKGSRFKKESTQRGKRPSNHLILLAMNNVGYKNLIKLVSLGYLEGFYYTPRVDKELLEKYNEGLIALSGCIKGEVAEKVILGKYEDAKKAALEFEKIFPDRFYLEIQDHGIPEQKIVIDAFSKMSKELDIPLVCSNDSHYNVKEDATSHDLLLCIGSKNTVHDENRKKYYGNQFYLKSGDEMEELFQDLPEAIENTKKIADRCNVEIKMGEYLQPEFHIPEESGIKDPKVYLEKLAKKGLKKRIGDKVKSKYEKRLDYELKVINKMDYPGYFLITSDFIQYAKNNNIPVGPGRGSAAGSLVAYSLGITNVDPLKYDLLFERFLNPDRVSMPDIDIDFCDEKRNLVIDYVKNKYGKKSVCQIITFGTLKAKGVVRDVTRVLGLPYSIGDKIAKMIPDKLGMTLEKAENMVQELREFLSSDDEYEKIWSNAKALEGNVRHAGMHAAGVVIAPGDLTDYLPLYKTGDDIVTQYAMKSLDDIGILKMDFLSLRTLTVIENTIELLKGKDIEIDIEKIPLNDKKVYELFSSGETVGVFQFESDGMRQYLKQLKPSKIEDLVAMNALYRPGPMGNIPSFIRRKEGKEEIEYLHPKLESILKSTYGIIVYQEQVIQIVSKVGGFTLSKADILRRAMGKKQRETLKKLRSEFVKGAKKKEISEKIANEIYDLLSKFADYGFNKSHAVAYSLIAYQTAYLKAHYPAEFFASILNSERGKIEKVASKIEEIKSMDIPIINPDVNVSKPLFSVKDGKIIYGLAAVKNVGDKAAESIANACEEGEKFTSLFDLTSRINYKAVNRKALEALICIGAMDSLPGNRNQLLDVVDDSLRYGQKYQDEKNSKQVSLFGADSQKTMMNEPKLKDLPDWKEKKKLDKEKEFIGFYLSGHPLEKYRDELEAFSNIGLLNKNNVGEYKIGGIITSQKMLFDKNDKSYSRFILETLSQKVTVLAFRDTYEKNKKNIVVNNEVFVTGKMSERDKDNKEKTIIMNSLIPLNELREKMVNNIHIRINYKKANPKELNLLINEILKKYSGKTNLIIHIIDKNNKEWIKRAKSIKVNSSWMLVEELKDELGKKNVWFS